MRICGVEVFLIRVSSVGKSHCQNFVVDGGLRIRGFQVIFLGRFSCILLSIFLRYSKMIFSADIYLVIQLELKFSTFFIRAIKFSGVFEPNWIFFLLKVLESRRDC